MKYDVFISYSSHDQKVVEGLCAYLEQQKIRCFVAYRDIPRGVVWARAIVDALDESRMMVVVFSEHFNNSDQVDREIELASEDKKPILTFRISDDVFKGAKKYYLKNINWIDAFPNPEQVFGSVAENVSSLLGIKLSTPSSQSTQSTPSVPKRSVELSPVIYQVGDYYDDGTRQGVVFAVSDDGRHGKIVSLDQTKKQWRTNEYKKQCIIFGASSDSDGKSNTDKVIARADSANYPAFQWCRAKGDEWYLPSKEELKLLYKVKDKINKTLRDKSMEVLGYNWYWSSTEKDRNFAWNVYMYDGGTYNRIKYFGDYVRAVSAF
ncbi:MAG: TIR domain-containing protein [Alistipes sp.]|nr:TIR domain-containing protein [Alistipes sp.]